MRKIEKLQRKREKAKNAVIFKQTCLQEDILPKYTNIYNKNKYKIIKILAKH